MNRPILAWVVPVQPGPGNHPDQGLPSAPGYPSQGLPVYPDQGLPGMPPRPGHELPPFPSQGLPGGGGGYPGQGLPPFPSHPIVLPPEGSFPGGPPAVVAPPIELPPEAPPNAAIIIPLPATGEGGAPVPTPYGVPPGSTPAIAYYGPDRPPVKVWLAPSATPK
jgi:hypothetical protein